MTQREKVLVHTRLMSVRKVVHTCCTSQHRGMRISGVSGLPLPLSQKEIATFSVRPSNLPSQNCLGVRSHRAVVAVVPPYTLPPLFRYSIPFQSELPHFSPSTQLLISDDESQSQNAAAPPPLFSFHRLLMEKPSLLTSPLSLCEE